VQAASIPVSPSPHLGAGVVPLPTYDGGELPFDTFKTNRHMEYQYQQPNHQLDSSNNWGLEDLGDSPFDTYTMPEQADPAENDLLSALDEIDQVLDSIPVVPNVN
jgi:hypothetical protein